MPEKLIEERFNVLGAQVEAAIAMLDADRAERVRGREAEEHRTRWWRRLTVVAVAGSLLGIVGALGVNNALNQLADDRKQGQVNSCNAYNEGLATSVNRIVEENIEFILFLGEDRPAPGEPPRTPEEQARIDELIAQRVAEFQTASVPYRDCSPEGIEAFSEGTGGYLLTGAEP